MAKDRNYLLGMYEKSMPSSLSWTEKLLCCKESGFDYLEISIDETDEKLARLDYDKKELDKIVAAMKDTGVLIKSMCLSGHRRFPLGSSDDNTVKKSLEIMAKAIDMAEYLGIRIIQLAGYDVYYEEGNDNTRDRFCQGLRIAVAMAARKGVLLGFETMETPFMDTAKKAMDYVNLIDSPYLNVYPDLGNLTNASKIYGVSVKDDLKTGKGKIIAAHLKDTLPGQYRDLRFGTGHTDYSAIEVLKDFGVRMFVGEFWYKGEEDWPSICKHSSAFLREKLDSFYL